MPPNHKPTAEQAAIIDAAKGKDSLMCNAYAGCAKTTTLEYAAAQVKVPALLLAFNKKIATDAGKRFPGNFSVKTMNGLGHGAWARRDGAGASLALDDRKLGKLITQISKDRQMELSSDQWDEVRKLVSKAMQNGLVPEGCGEPGFIPDTADDWRDCALQVGMLSDDFEFVAELAREVLIEDIRLARAGTVSFDDQVYCSTLLGGKFPQFPVVFVDEAQDLSPLNHKMVELCLRDQGRLFVVGDEKQCHPAGTQIQLEGGKTAMIEDIQVGDRVVSYNRKVGFSGVNAQGSKITDKRVFHFKGKLVRIMTEGPFAHECTPNHRCHVRWNEKKGYAIYLMRKGDYYRIGTAQTWYNTPSSNGSFGPAMRARQEGADEMWVLDVFPTKDEALVQEKVIWTLFGLPDLIFKCSGKSSSTQEHLNEAWNRIGPNKARAKLCLEYFNRDIAFPIWTKGSGVHIGEKTFITEACNIVNGAMTVKVFDGTAECETWLKCWIDYEDHDGPVFGITVGGNGYGLNLYVANGIVTHNSIYAFRGADGRSMQSMERLRESWTRLPLATTFRCPKAIVARQRGHAPGFTAWHTNAEGTVARLGRALPDGPEAEELAPIWGWHDVQRALPSPTAEVAVLCRNNGPLLSLAFKLIRQNIGVVMLGRDIGKGLISLSRKILPDDSTPAEHCKGLVSDWMLAESSKARANGLSTASIEDRGDCLLAVLDAGVRDAGQLRVALQRLFARESGQVTLGSIHRSKGLEWDLVLHLDPWRMPSRYARESAKAGDPIPLEQEHNLIYVCETRTKHTLLTADLEGFR